MRIATAFAAALLALAAVATAQGHASPERFDLGPGAVLDAAPARVHGWFTQDIRRQEDESFLRVYRGAPRPPASGGNASAKPDVATLCGSPGLR